MASFNSLIRSYINTLLKILLSFLLFILLNSLTKNLKLFILIGSLTFNNTTNGVYTRGTMLYDGVGTNVNFGKGAGFGDVEVLCKPAPIEIGNLVWYDAMKMAYKMLAKMAYKAFRYSC